ncbi:MAG: hypothetical protein ACRDL5_17095 [Solirubrobacteraceae bacterium]
MTKLDLRSKVPVIDGAARARLAAALNRPGVVSALVFGSQATGRTGSLCDVDVDVDVGVWAQATLARGDRDGTGSRRAVSATLRA